MSSIHIDGDRLLRDLRLPYFTMAKLREMKVGEVYELFDVYGPPMFPEGSEATCAGASIERIKGGLCFNALWMLNVGRKGRKRPIMFVPSVVLKQVQKRNFELQVDKEAHHSHHGLRLFVRIVRLAHRLADMAKAAGELDCERKLRPTVFGYPEERCGYVVPFLNRISNSKWK
jgi:hypothetical protein